MKLHEVRYQGEHPVIAAVADTLNSRDAGKITFWDIEERDVPRILKSLTAKYGESRPSPDGHSHHWTIRQKSGRLKNHITIGWDPDMDTPYGVEVY